MLIRQRTSFYRRNIFFVAAVLLVLQLSCAQNGIRSANPTPSYCEVNTDAVVREIVPDVEPRYFFKPAGTKNQIGFVGVDPVHQKDQNYLFDLETGKKAPLPGRLDPIGLFGTELISVPMDDGTGDLRLEFYDLRQPARALFALPKSGRYQSLGVLKNEGLRVQFRLVTDGSGGGDYQDFEVDFGFTPAKVRSIRPKRPICQNVGNLKLPMLSKDAKLFSGFDTGQQIMRLFSINSTGKCIPIEGPSLGKGDLGKFDFSPDSSKIAFHFSDRPLSYEPLMFGVPGLGWQLRSAVYDRSNRSYQLLPFFGKDTHTYFPAFLPNGNLLVLKNEKSRYSFLEVDISKIKPVSQKSMDRFGKLSPDAFREIQILSDRWNQECLARDQKITRTRRLFSVLTLSLEQCLELAASSISAGLCRQLLVDPE